MLVNGLAIASASRYTFRDNKRDSRIRYKTYSKITERL